MTATQMSPAEPSVPTPSFEGIRLRVTDLNPLIDPADPLRTMVHVGAVLESLADSLEDMQQLPDLWGVGLALRCAQCALQFHREFGGAGPESVVAVRSPLG